MSKSTIYRNIRNGKWVLAPLTGGGSTPTFPSFPDGALYPNAYVSPAEDTIPMATFCPDWLFQYQQQH